MDVFNAEKTGGANGDLTMPTDDCHFVSCFDASGGLGINLTSRYRIIFYRLELNTTVASRIGVTACIKTRPVAVYRPLTVNSVDIEMMEKQISVMPERMTIAGGDFRKGRRSRGDISFDYY
jgi:ATP-dependent DNA helicase